MHHTIWWMYGACMVHVWCMYGACMVHFENWGLSRVFFVWCKSFAVWYWNLRRFSFSEHLQDIQHSVSLAHYSLRSNVPGTVFNTTHQVKADAIAISEDNHLAKIVSVFFFLLLYMYWDLSYCKLHLKRDWAGIHPYLVSLYCNQFSLRYCIWQ